MDCSSPACEQCTKNCLLIHGKTRDPSSVVTSFFKVMISDNFSEVLFLPPKIARMLPLLIDQKTQLEDACGKRWTVTVSKSNGSLAFQQGWNTFSLEHGLEIGDFTVFHYIMGSHFVVRIYGKNGCEKLKFSDENGARKKRTRTNRHSRAEAGRNHSTESDSMNKQGSTTSAVSGSNVDLNQSQPIATDNTLNIDNGNDGPRPFCRTKCAEEPFYMIGRDARNRQDDHWNSLFDLSNFEMQRASGVDETNRVLEQRISPSHGNKMPKSQAVSDMVDKILVTGEVLRSLPLSDVPNLATRERNEYFQTTENIMPVSEKDSGNDNTFRQEQRIKAQSSDDQALIPQKVDNPLMHSSQRAQHRVAVVSEFSGFPATVQTQNCQSGERVNVVKAEQVEMSKVACGLREMVNGKNPEIKDHDQSSNHAVQDNDYVCKVVKTEPVDSFELSPTDAVNISLTVTDRQCFTELPMRLPLVSLKGRPRMEKKAVVLLRDPVSRLWPVLYNEKYGLKVLTSGWKAFVTGNSIRPGDECVFEVENVFECIYRVVIVRK